MCHGPKRNGLSANGSANRTSVNRFYYGYSSVCVRRPVTGKLYRFSRLQPVQTVDARDAAPTLKTRLFRRTR